MTVPDASTARKFDVLALGGGPAGATIAALLARPRSICDAAAVRVENVVVR